MKHKECNRIRLEIDEGELDAKLSPTALQHLRECAECREFQNKQTSLRQIIGSLETVNAPADFDFRLRARLTNAETSSEYQFLSSLPLMRSPVFAVAVLVLLVIGAYAFLRVSVPQEQQIAITQPASDKNNAQVKEPETPANNVDQEVLNGEKAAAQSLADNSVPKRVVGSTTAQKRATATVDLGSTAAPVIRSNQSVAGMNTFPIDISQESFKVSIDDGRGTSRTISLPGVSFGSRRVLTGRNVSHQFAPNGVW